MARRGRSRPRDATVPAFLSFDVEPDNLGMRDGVADWDGYATYVELVETLRAPLREASGASPAFGWYFRMDPQIEAVYGRADHAVTGFPTLLDRLDRCGDVFGIHVHPIRWDEVGHRWFHEHADAEWIAGCVEAGFAAYRGAFGHPPTRHRFGNAFLSDAILQQVERLGVGVDLTVEPGTPPTWWDGSLPPNAATPDMVHAPTHPYRPSADDFCREDPDRDGPLVVVPLSSASARFDKPGWWRALRAVRRGLRQPPQPLNPWRAWPSPEAYWDLVAGQLASMRQPYLALAIRTDDPHSQPARRSMALLEALPRHRIARTLRIVDPLDTVGELVPARRRSPPRQVAVEPRPGS
jgi:hypothetical protein